MSQRDAHYHPKGQSGESTFVWHSHENAPRGHRHVIVMPQTVTGRRPTEPEFQNIPLLHWRLALAEFEFDEAVTVPCTWYGGGGKLNYEKLCPDEAVEEVWCAWKQCFRTFCQTHATRMKAYQRNVLQGSGREVGYQVAVDALIALATAPYPWSVTTAGEKAEFDRALRREFLKVIQESITEPPEKSRGWWCLAHREYHPFSTTACWCPERA